MGTKKRLLTEMSTYLYRGLMSDEILSKSVTVKQGQLIAGPRAGAVELYVGTSAPQVLTALSKKDCALARQFVPWDFTGDPQVRMRGRYIRVEAGWPRELEEVDILLDTMKENINKGIFKFVVLMDQLETRLKDLIRFINQNSQFDVYAVELEYYKFNEHELMIPKLYGAEIKKDLSVSSSPSIRKSWDEASYFKELKTSVDNDTYALIKDFYEFSIGNFDMLSWGSGKKGAFSIGDSSLFPKSIYTVKSDGTLVLNLGWHSESAEKVEKIASLLRDISFDLEGPPYKQHYFYSFSEWSEKIEDIKNSLQDLI